MSKPTSLETEDLNLLPLLKTVQDAPWDTIKQCKSKWNKMEMGYHRRLYVFAATAIGFARLALDREDLRVNLYSQPVFSRNSLDAKAVPSARKILRLTFRYLLDGAANKGPAYDRACDYAVALDDFVISSIAIEDVPAKIEDAGGLEELIEKKRDLPCPGAATAEGAWEGSAVNSKAIVLGGRVSQSPFVQSPKLVGTHTPDNADDPPHEHSAIPPRALRLPRTRFDDRKHLLIEASDEIMEIVLSLDENERAILKIRDDGEEEDGLRRLVAMEVKVFVARR